MPVPIVAVIAITISASPLPKGMMERALVEADAIWRTAGVALEWQHTAAAAGASVQVEFVDEPGVAPDREVALAWIDVANDRPTNRIYVSRLNAMRLVGTTSYLPHDVEMLPAAVNEVVGRALGRALAHEIGHYLFRSRAHDIVGVMATRRPPQDLFGRDRASFLSTARERRRLEDVFLAQRKAGPAARTEPCQAFRWPCATTVARRHRLSENSKLVDAFPADSPRSCPI